MKTEILSLVSASSAFFFAATPVWSLSPALPSLNETVETVARQLAREPWRTLAVRDIREEKSLARWPLSEQLEAGLISALSQQHPPYAILNCGLAAPLGKGADGVLTGSFRRDHEGFTLSLRVEDPPGERTLKLLPPVRFLAPEGALPEKGFGKLILGVEPAEALVFVDGKPMGKGSSVLPLPLGRHLLTIAQEGFQPYDEPIMIRDNTQRTVRLSPKGSVLLDANLPAAVWVDGVEKGQTPLALDLVGKHRIAFRKTGYKPFEQTLEVTQGQVVRADLARIPGKVLVTSEVPAEVEIDGKPSGRTPLLVPEVAVGTHQVKVLAAGFAPFEQEVSLASGQVLSVRATPGAVGEDNCQASLLLPATANRADRELWERLKQRVGPSKDLIIEDALFEEEPSAIRNFARAHKARRVLLLGVERFVPFRRILGLWPQRPRMEATLKVYSPKGAPVEKLSFMAEGEEPLGLGNEAGGPEDLLERIAPKIAEHLTGVSAPLSTEAIPLKNGLSILYSPERLHLGLGLERRIHPFFEVGLGYQYFNALAADRDGTTLAMEGPGASLVYGLGQSHLGRFDLLLRLNPEQEARDGNRYEGPRWVPYLGAGYRARFNRFEVFGAGSKQSEGHFDRLTQRGVAIGGCKLELGGAVTRAELEYPVVTEAKDPPDVRFLFGAGWLF